MNELEQAIQELEASAKQDAREVHADAGIDDATLNVVFATTVRALRQQAHEWRSAKGALTIDFANRLGKVMCALTMPPPKPAGRPRRKSRQVA
jgi:hypothetical protein